LQHSIFASFDLPELNYIALANEAPCFRYCTIVQQQRQTGPNPVLFVFIKLLYYNYK